MNMKFPRKKKKSVREDSVIGSKQTIQIKEEIRLIRGAKQCLASRIHMACTPSMRSRKERIKTEKITINMLTDN